AVRPFLFNYPADQAQSRLRWPVGSYRVTDLLVAENSSKSEKDDYCTLEVLGGLITGRSNSMAAVFNGRRGRSSRSPVQPEITDWAVIDPRDASLAYDGRFSQVRDKVQPVLDLKPQVVNQIKIPIPERLADNVAKFLNAEEQRDRD